MTPTKYQNFVKLALVSSCYLSLHACRTSGGFDDDAINQRSVYREDDTEGLLPSPRRAAEEARLDKGDDMKLAERGKNDEAIMIAESDGILLDDLKAAHAQILVPKAPDERAYFAPANGGAQAKVVTAMKSDMKTGSTTRRKPVFLGKIGLQAMMKQAKAVDVNAPAAVTGGMMSLSARSGRGAGKIANRENMGSYIVQPGDTLSTISMKIYGTSGRWMEIAHLNRLGDGSVIFPKELILYVPDQAAAAP
ncbi:LysM peptidoglycan-binding domain-containing protein [Oligoflexus tunisiensis]|uniref:LysM peptidoglycan-binding domain-containing protein n=1 Tax=Oligoflexus tunisiensis TaxID=708132 RepID=UPI00114CD626|nr:LysM peptidoglycan-binding domain-containing protein [Oligoflexus tunisiensis]